MEGGQSAPTPSFTFCCFLYPINEIPHTLWGGVAVIPSSFFPQMKGGCQLVPPFLSGNPPHPFFLFLSPHTNPHILWGRGCFNAPSPFFPEEEVVVTVGESQPASQVSRTPRFYLLTRWARVRLRSFMTSSKAAVSSACFWLCSAIFSLNFRGLFDEAAIFARPHPSSSSPRPPRSNTSAPLPPGSRHSRRYCARADKWTEAGARREVANTQALKNARRRGSGMRSWNPKERLYSACSCEATADPTRPYCAGVKSGRLVEKTTWEGG